MNRYENDLFPAQNLVEFGRSTHAHPRKKRSKNLSPPQKFARAYVGRNVSPCESEGCLPCVCEIGNYRCGCLSR